MKKKENQRIALTKRLLKESLLQLIAEKSIHSITVSELCETAGINRSTFYNHYGCPTDVLTDIEEGVVSDLEHIWQKDGAGKNWPINKRVEALCGYLQDHRNLAKLLFRNSDTNSGFASRMINASLVRETYEKELAYAQSQDNIKLAITFLSNGTYHMIRQWILEDVPKTPEEMGDLVYHAAIQGWIRPSADKAGRARS